LRSGIAEGMDAARTTLFERRVGVSPCAASVAHAADDALT